MSAEGVQRPQRHIGLAGLDLAEIAPGHRDRSCDAFLCFTCGKAQFSQPSAQPAQLAAQSKLDRHGVHANDRRRSRVATVSDDRQLVGGDSLPVHDNLLRAQSQPGQTEGGTAAKTAEGGLVGRVDVLAEVAVLTGLVGGPVIVADVHVPHHIWRRKLLPGAPP